MQSDIATRVLLGAILVCLIILIVQGSSSGRAPAEPIGRYSVTGMRAGAPILVRADSATGRAWKLELRGPAEHWVEFREEAADSGATAPGGEPDQERPDPVGGDQPLQ
jgi:hypothetical protein